MYSTVRPTRRWRRHHRAGAGTAASLPSGQRARSGLRASSGPGRRLLIIVILDHIASRRPRRRAMALGRVDHHLLLLLVLHLEARRQRRDLLALLLLPLLLRLPLFLLSASPRTRLRARSLG